MSVKINKEELLEILSRRKGVQFAKISYVSDPRCRKTGNPFTNVKKRVVASVEIGVNYKRKLEKAMVENGGNGEENLLHSRTWGSHVEGTPFIEHTKDGEKRFYLECIIQKVISKEFSDDTGPVREEDLKDFLPKKQERLVQLADIEIGNIKTVTINGETYEVE